MTEEIELTVTELPTELQLTKDSSIQAVPLTNKEYEKALSSFGKDKEDE